MVTIILILSLFIEKVCYFPLILLSLSFCLFCAFLRVIAREERFINRFADRQADGHVVFYSIDKVCEDMYGAKFKLSWVGNNAIRNVLNEILNLFVVRTFSIFLRSDYTKIAVVLK